MQNSTVSTGDGLYGLGWWVDENSHGYRRVFAQGGTHDSSAWLMLIPSEDIGVAALANTGTRLPHMVIDEVLAAVLPKYLANSPFSKVLGRWTGNIRTYRSNVPLAFSFRSSELYAKIGTQATTLVTDARFENQRLTGKMSGDLGIPNDTGTASYDLEFELFLRDGVLNGAVTTRSHASPLPGPSLPFWVELRRETGAQ
jgi:hypothetical protein